MDDGGGVVLARRVGERLFIYGPGGDHIITIQVTRVSGGQAGLRVIADRKYRILREELDGVPRKTTQEA